MLKRLRRRFGTLRWKLTWSYVWVSIVISLLINLGILSIILGFTPTLTSEGTQRIIEEYAQDLNPIISNVKDPTVLQLILQNKFSESSLNRLIQNSSNGLQTSPNLLWLSLDEHAFDLAATLPLTNPNLLMLLDKQGKVLAGTYLASYPVGSQWLDPQTQQQESVVQAALANVPSAKQKIVQTANQLILTAPILNNQGQVMGVIYVRSNHKLTQTQQTWLIFAGVMIVSFLSTFLINGLIGLIYGWFASRSLVRRLKRLNQASVALAEGTLTTRIQDDSNDEIGQLGRQFNVMAEQLEANLRDLRQLVDRNAALAEQTGHLAIIEERNRLARDLHDSVSQELFSVTMLAAAAQNLLPAQPDKARSHIEQLNQMSQRALHEIRGLIFALRPAALGDQGLTPALRQLRDEAQRRQGLTVNLTISGERRLQLEQEQALYRITQEALANVIKHSGVQQVNVDLEYDDDRTILTISDHGKGFDAKVPHGSHSLGLISIKERANAVGGTLEVQSIPNQGTTITVAIPRERTKKLA